MELKFLISKSYSFFILIIISFSIFTTQGMTNTRIYSDSMNTDIEPNENSAEINRNDLKLSLTANHILPLIQQSSFDNPHDILIIGDKTSNPLINTIFTNNPFDEGANITNIFLSLLNDTISFSNYQEGLNDNFNIYNIDLGSGSIINNEVYDIIEAEIRNITDTIIISFFDIYGDFDELAELLIQNNNLLIMPKIEYYLHNLSIPNIYFISYMEIDNPELLFTYQKYRIPTKEFSNSLSTFFVPIISNSNRTLPNQQYSVALFSFGIISLMNENINDTYKLSLSLINSSRLVEKIETNIYIQIPDFYQTMLTYYNPVIIVARNPFYDIGYMNENNTRLTVNSGDTFTTKILVLYYNEEENSTADAKYQLFMNQSTSFAIPIDNHKGAIELILDVNVPLFEDKLTLKFEFTTKIENVLNYTYHANIKTPSKGFIGITSQLIFSSSFKNLLRKSGWSLIHANTNSTSLELIDIWVVTSLIEFGKFEIAINKTLSQGGTMILALNPENLEIWNRPTNYLSGIKLVNITNILDPSEEHDFQETKLTSNKEYFEIPMQVTKEQSWIEPTTTEVETILGNGLVFDLYNISKRSNNKDGNITSIIDVYPLNGIYSGLLNQNYLNGNLFLIPDSYFIRDFTDEVNLNLISQSIRSLLVTLDTIEIETEQNNGLLKIQIHNIQNIDIRIDEIRIFTDKPVDIEIISLQTENNYVLIKIKFTNSNSVNISAFIKIPYIPTLFEIIQINNSILGNKEIILGLFGLGIFILTIFYYKRYIHTKSCKYCFGINHEQDSCKYCGRELL